MFVVERQEYALFLVNSMLLGALLAVIYLLLGFVRIAFWRMLPGVRGLLPMAVIDLAFCFLAAFLNVLMIFASNRGQVRISALAFEIFGFCVLYLPFKKTVLKMQKKILSYMKNRIVLPISSFILGKMRRIFEKGRRLCLLSRVKRYNRRLDRLIRKAAEDAVKKGEGSLFPEK